MRTRMIWWLRHAALLVAVWVPATQAWGAEKDTPAGKATQKAGPAVVNQEASAEAATPSPAASDRSEAAGDEEAPPVLRVSQPASAIRLRRIVPERPAGEPAEVAPEKPSEPVGKPAEDAVPKPAAGAQKPADSPAFRESEKAPEAAGTEPAPAEKEAVEAPLAASPPKPVAPLKPVPDPQSAGMVDVQAASFKGVTPGVTTAAALAKAWGEPVRIATQDGKQLRLYRVDPFDQVEVTIAGQKVAAIVIRLKASFPAKTVAEQLELSDVRPVLVSDELGRVLGQSFPERGVLFAFEPSEEPGKATMRVNSVILEPVGAESFVLRAETYLESQTELSLQDLNEAIRLDPSNHRAHWLLARALAALGRPLEGGISSDKAVQLDPQDAQYRLTRARILAQVGRYAEATEDATRALQDCQKRPHVKAQIECLLGDLAASGAEPDYKKAFQHHSEALKTAGPLVNNPHPAIRIAAKRAVLNAYLGAANDIAWGFWDEKDKAVPRWLERAEAVAEDLIEKERGSRELRLRVASRALAAYVGLEGQLDPTAWAEKATQAGQDLVASLGQSARSRQLHWDLGMALYDAVQTFQMRGEHAAALKYGERAIEYLENGRSLHPSNMVDAYLLGRLYFRLGAIHSIGNENHRAAISWFEKAIPVFENVGEKLSPQEHGRLGETYVSMGVSYWNVGQKEKAVELTERGVQLIEEAVENGKMEKTSLEVPYSNLATMHGEMGKTEEAEKFLKLATQQKDTQLK